MAVIRYIVDDVDAAVEFYTEVLGFELGQRFPPFAAISKGDQQIWLSGPASSAGKPMPDGAQPVPGGWNRIVVEVDDIKATVAQLREQGITFRNQPLSGPGGTQVLIEDPAGNPIEVFQPAS